MTQAELYQALNEIGLPLKYYEHEEEVTTPYLVYLFAYSNDFMADDVNYKSIDNFQVELYTDIKDLASEKKVEDKFKELGLSYGKIEERLDTERLFQVVYTIQLI